MQSLPQNSHPPQPPSIAIIGGGPGGLTLARILHRHGLASTVFERDARPLDRPQGGSLDLHADTGLRALRLAGLDDAFRPFARYEDQGAKVYHSDGRLLYEDFGRDGHRPEIDRTQLRQILLDSLPPATVRWSQKVDAIQPLPDSRYEVITNGQPGEAFDLVIGADGARSRVRPLVSSAALSYEGATFVELGIDEADVRYPELGALVGHGKMFAKGKGKTLVGQRSSQSHLRVYAALRVPEGGLALNLAHPQRAKEQLLELFADFAPNLRALIAAAEPLAIRPVYALPIGHRWENRPGLTLIGDAAHLMSPFGGEGANCAMADGADLALALVNNPADWRQSVADFEETMLTRAEPAARGAAQGIRGAVSEDAQDHVLEHFQSGPT